jgi:hypothetical protein
MKKTLVGFITVIALTVGLSAWTTSPLSASQDTQNKKTDTPGIAGKWKMSVDSPEGAISCSLLLVQDGKKVTGTFSSPHGDLPLEGEFAVRTLTFSVTLDGHGPGKTVFDAKLRDDGTLAGKLSGPMGDMAWTAERVTTMTAELTSAQTR